MVGYVYIIGAAEQTDQYGPFKIGSSHDPESRLYTFQIGSPVVLKVFHTKLCETVHHALCEGKVHLALQGRRLHGEWFRVRLDLAKCIVDAVVERDDTPNTSYRGGYLDIRPPGMSRNYGYDPLDLPF